MEFPGLKPFPWFPRPLSSWSRPTLNVRQELRSGEKFLLKNSYDLTLTTTKDAEWRRSSQVMKSGHLVLWRESQVFENIFFPSLRSMKNPRVPKINHGLVSAQMFPFIFGLIGKMYIQKEWELDLADSRHLASVFLARQMGYTFYPRAPIRSNHNGSVCWWYTHSILCSHWLAEFPMPMYL